MPGQWKTLGSLRRKHKEALGVFLAQGASAAADSSGLHRCTIYKLAHSRAGKYYLAQLREAQDAAARAESVRNTLDAGGSRESLSS